MWNFMLDVQRISRNDGKNARIRELRAVHLVPFIRTLQLIEDAALAGQREAYWIRHFRQLEIVLTNDITYMNMQVEDDLEGEGQEAEERRKRYFITLAELAITSGYTVRTLEKYILAGLLKRHNHDKDKIYVSSVRNLRRYKAGKFSI
jgi:hypothetical protein